MQYYRIVIQKYATKKILIQKYVTNKTSIQNMFQYLADIFGVKKYIFLHFKQYFLIGFDYGNNCNQHISRIYKKMKVWNLDVIWQCWSYLQICVFVSNIGSVHYLEMPASLWGGTVSAPFIPHSFNGGSKSHISREQDFSPLSVFKCIFTAVSTEAAKVTCRERHQNLTTEILLLAPSESWRSLFKLSLLHLERSLLH